MATTTTQTDTTTRRGDGRFGMARSRGAITGPVLMLLGAWGAIIPFIGHSFGYGFTPDNTWAWTAARGWLEVAPGVAVFVGGLLLMTTSNRASAMFGSWLAAAGGAWFVIGTTIAPYWSAGNIGTPSGDTHRAVWERIGMFNGLGAVIVLFAAMAIGRVSVVGVRDVAAVRSRREAQAQRDAEEAAAADQSRRAEENRQIDLDRGTTATDTDTSGPAAPVRVRRMRAEQADADVAANRTPEGTTPEGTMTVGRT